MASVAWLGNVIVGGLLAPSSGYVVQGRRLE